MDYWLVILGNGSFSLGAGQPTWRGPNKFKITPEQAEGVLAWKEQHGDVYWLVISTEEPFLPDTQLTGTLELADIRFGSRHRAEPEPQEDAEYEPEPDDAEADDPEYDEPEPEFYCGECGLTFLNSAGLRRHVMLHHTGQHHKLEAAAREQLAAAKAARAAQERISQAPSDELHPAERRLEDEPSEPSRPSLWPKGLGGYLP